LFFEDVIFPSVAFSLEDIVDPTGAGDSFAGAMIGYLASKKSTNLSEIKKAAVYGNVLGSFVVERYGVDALLALNKSKIENRVRKYQKMIGF
jgi:sugar/nucleoside kinase (ribokinase family)